MPDEPRSTPAPMFRDVGSLIIMHLENALDARQTQMLDAMLRQSDDARDLFVAVCMQQQVIYSRLGPEWEADASPRLSDRQQSLSNLREVLELEEQARQYRATVGRAAADTAQPNHDLFKTFTIGQDSSQPPVRHIVIPKSAFYGTIAAMIAILVALVWPRGAEQATPPDLPQTVDAPVETPRYAAVAMLLQQVDAKWEGGVHQIGVGEPLFNEPLRLVEGVARIRFRNGADVIVEAPASFTPISNAEVRLTSGKLVGHCASPESRGFTVRTPTTVLVDIGTEFGIGVDEQGGTMVQVFEGAVDVGLLHEETATSLERVNAGEGRAVDAAGRAIRTIASDPLAFVRNDEFDARERADESPLHRWLALSYELRRHPDLVAYYPFAEPDPFTLPNEARATRDRLHGKFGDGVDSVTRPSWVPGRIDGKAALAFDPNAKQHLRVDADEALQLERMTILAWVKPTKPYHSGAIVARHDERVRDYQFGIATPIGGPGEESWRVQFIFAQDEQDRRIAHSSRRLPRDEQWIQLAATYDGNAYSLYINGELIDRVKRSRPNVQGNGPLYIGASYWSKHRPWFSGCIDEIAIFSTALGEDEIRDIYERGKP